MASAWQPMVGWILAVSLFPLASLYLILLALLSVLLNLFKTILLFSTFAINIPFVVMFNISWLALHKVLMTRSTLKSFVEYFGFEVKLMPSEENEVKVIVSDFFKVLGGDLLLVLSTGVITYYTAPLLVFSISMAVGVTAILLKWLNTNCLSKTAFSCLCARWGLNPLMFLCSFIGLFDIGCHPIAKCSFTADKAFLFNGFGCSPNISFTHTVTVDHLKNTRIDYPWNAFERGLFQLRARIDFVNRDGKQPILKTSMVLYLCGREICIYPIDRLELPRYYPRTTELLSFLQILEDGFVTDIIRGCTYHEHSLTLQQIVDGVERSYGYMIVYPSKSCYAVVGRTDYGSTL